MSENVTDGPGRIPRDATPLLAMLIDEWKKSWEERWDDEKPITGEDRIHLIERQCDQFGAIAFLAALRETNPEFANKVAEFAAEMWDSGDALGELVYQWADDLAAGNPLVVQFAEQDGLFSGEVSR